MPLAIIVSAYVSKNPVPAANLGELIATVHGAVAGLSKPFAPADQLLTPAVNPKRSVFPDYMFWPEDGKRFKSSRCRLVCSPTQSSGQTS